MPGADGDPLAVLVVCTANICRSPVAAGLLEHRTAVAGAAVDVSSAGFLFDGEPAAPDSVSIMAEMGIDISAHRSRIIDPAMVRAADLVVTMERTHARSLAIEVPDSADRIHTIGALVAGLARSTTELTRDRIVELGRERSAEDLLGRGDDEIDDPYGRPLRFHRRTAQRLDRLTGEIVTGLGGP